MPLALYLKRGKSGYGLEGGSVLYALLNICLIQHSGTDLTDPVVTGIVHSRFIIIHPFCNGNGCTARILTVPGSCIIMRDMTSVENSIIDCFLN